MYFTLLTNSIPITQQDISNNEELQSQTNVLTDALKPVPVNDEQLTTLETVLSRQKRRVKNRKSKSKKSKARERKLRKQKERERKRNRRRHREKNKKSGSRRNRISFGSHTFRDYDRESIRRIPKRYDIYATADRLRREYRHPGAHSSQVEPKRQYSHPCFGQPLDRISAFLPCDNALNLLSP